MLARSSGRMTSAVPISLNLESSCSKTRARSGCCSAKGSHSVKNIPHDLLTIRRRKVDARLRAHDDHMDLGLQRVSDKPQLGAREPVEIAEMADSVLPHAVHRIIEKFLADHRVPRARAVCRDPPASRRSIVDSVRTCLGLAFPLDVVQAADHLTEVDRPELFNVEPWLDELRELLSKFLVVSVLL